MTVGAVHAFDAVADRAVQREFAFFGALKEGVQRLDFGDEL
jgi:hypothetical protein